MVRDFWARRAVRVGLPLAVGVLLATFLPGRSMLVVALPVGWAVLEAVRARDPRDGAVGPLTPGAPCPSASSSADTDQRGRTEWLGWLAASLDAARAAEARRQAHARLDGQTRGAREEARVDADGV